MALTKEQIAELPEHLRGEVLKVQGQVEAAEGFVKEIFANPDSRKDFAKINSRMPAEKKLQIPDDPLENYVAPLHAKIGELEGVVKKNEDEKLLNKVYSRMAELDIPAADIDKVIKFQDDNKIQDPMAAIDLFAKTMDREPEVVNHGGKPFYQADALDEKTAMDNSINEIMNLRRTAMRR